MTPVGVPLLFHRHPSARANSYAECTGAAGAGARCAHPAPGHEVSKPYNLRGGFYDLGRRVGAVASPQPPAVQAWATLTGTLLGR